MMDPQLNNSGVVTPTSSFPRYNCLSSSGELNNGSMVPRSFSPTKDSRATTRVKASGKNPITSTTNGIRLSRINPPPKRFIKPIAWRVVLSATNGKRETSRSIGTTIRQSRTWSMTSRRATSQIAFRSRCIDNSLGIGHGLQIHMLQSSRHLRQRNKRSVIGGEYLNERRIRNLRHFHLGT